MKLIKPEGLIKRFFEKDTPIAIVIAPKEIIKQENECYNQPVKPLTKKDILNYTGSVAERVYEGFRRIFESEKLH